MVKCQYCGKDYVKNENKYFKMLPEGIKKKLEYIPECECLEKNKIKEMEELEKKRIQECIKNRVKKCGDISVMDKKFLNSRFENADMNSDHMQLAKKYAESFLKKDKKEGILFYGGVGTGKTFVSACIGNYLMERGKTVIVINLGLYFNKL
ncbi:MAG: AAA family ATPase, partial [Fusobacterium sp.]|nr:AAA family ATPase [Fusobacterium sp.]